MSCPIIAEIASSIWKELGCPPDQDPNYISQRLAYLPYTRMLRKYISERMNRGNVKICGLYSIVNKISGKRYLGSSLDILGRFRAHKSDLRNNKHGNQHLQNSWNKYGEEGFDFVIIKIVDEDSRIQEEQMLLNEAFKNRKSVYNIATEADAGMKGRNHTEATKEKIAAAKRGKSRSRESVMKGAAARVGTKASQETRAKLSLARLGKKSPRKGIPMSDETCLKMSLAHRGKKFTEEHKRKIGHSRKMNLLMKQYMENGLNIQACLI